MSRTGANAKRAERDVSKAATPLVEVYGVTRLRDEYGNLISGWVAFSASLPAEMIAEGVVRTTEPLTHAEACGWIEERMRDGVGR